MMQCSCGNQTVDRTQVKDKEVVTRYAVCWHPLPGGESGGCGRVYVFWRKEVPDEVTP